jgi:hypothetical protein
VFSKDFWDSRQLGGYARQRVLGVQWLFRLLFRRFELSGQTEFRQNLVAMGLSLGKPMSLNIKMSAHLSPVQNEFFERVNR